MSITEHELEIELERVEDPMIGEDIVSLGLVNDLSIEDETARISLAFNTPYAPAEMVIGRRIREVVSEAGLEPVLGPDVSADLGFDEEIMPKVRNIVAVASGKGGVGKTTVAANLAAGLQQMGARVGILDADIHGPNVPRILPVEDEPAVTPEEELIPPRSNGVRVMSMGLMMQEEDDPAILRGPMVNKFMRKLFDDVTWGNLDYLIVDLPPGTGDASLDLLQSMPLAGAVIVTTPQEMALDDTRKGLRMFQEHDTPIVGVVENMSTFICPSCDDEHGLFGEGGADEIGEKYGVNVLPKLPLHSDFGGENEGAVVTDDDSPVQDHVRELVEAAADRIGEINRRKVAEARGEGASLDAEIPTEPSE